MLIASQTLILIGKKAQKPHIPHTPEQPSSQPIVAGFLRVTFFKGSFRMSPSFPLVLQRKKMSHDIWLTKCKIKIPTIQIHKGYKVVQLRILKIYFIIFKKDKPP